MVRKSVLAVIVVTSCFLNQEFVKNCMSMQVDEC